MIHISRTPEFSNCGSCPSLDQGTASFTGGRGRQRSHSYYSQEDPESYGAQVQTAETNLRPRSRYVYTISFYCVFSAYLFSMSVSLSVIEAYILIPRELHTPQVILHLRDIRI